jgi:hypothetical protein|tara:strand:- start:254 stop:1894 length:1641 start_codon:yes stop_codon:yes gene_type:complete
MLYYDRDKYDFTYTEYVKGLLDTEIKEFSELTDYYRVKKTGRQVNVKSNLYTMASNHYWMRVRAHSKDDRATALPAKWLLEQLSHDYRRIIRILFNVSDEWEFRKTTKKYTLKDSVVEIFDRAFGDHNKRQILIDGIGKQVKREGVVNVNSIKRHQYNYDGETTKEAVAVKKQLYIPNQVKINQKRLAEAVGLYGELKYSVLKRITLSKRTERILKSAGLKIKDLTPYKAEKYEKTIKELLMRINLEPFDYGHIYQLYSEREFGGRLYNDGANGLMTIPKHIKHIVMSGLGYYDYDLVNCHWNFLEQLNKHYGGGALLYVSEYNSKVKTTRKEIAKEIGVDEDIMKFLLIAMLYGAKLNINEKHWDTDKRRKVGSKVLEKLRGIIGDEKTARVIGRRFFENKFVKGLYGDIQTAKDTILKKCKKTGKGNNTFIENYSGNKIKISVKGAGGKAINRSGGKQLSHLLQGMESFILHDVVAEMDRDKSADFLVPYHDGWVCSGKIDKRYYEQHIFNSTQRLLSEYDGKEADVGISVKISGGAMDDPFKQ